ncbi:lysozyme [Aspergillus lucknowensis]|uniref:Lysozyme n=1 Tax=Aspergillus lucknowensis TaxID=176173 RepID=A0ABR4M193_9EURO
MKFSALTLAAAIGLTQAHPRHSKHWARADSVQGFDISHYQETFDFAGAYAAGARFCMIKATEGTTYTDPSFGDHYQGATDASIFRGAYHFALPDSSSATEQAQYFLDNGGGWTADNRTLPGMLDIEYNPYGDTCYGLAAEDMVAWVQEFVDAYQSSTGRYPMLYTTADWWSTCTGDAAGFGATVPLVLAAYSDSAPSTIPGDWETYTIWQNSNEYEFGGDSDIFNGGIDGVQRLVAGA